MAVIKAEQILYEGHARGEIMRLTAPISFWGGVSPDTGNIIMEGHPQQGQSIASKILIIQKAVGSSSGSSILLELLANRNAPAAIIMPECDAILVLAVIVAREMGLKTIPMLRLQESVSLDLIGVAEIESGKVKYG